MKFKVNNSWFDSEEQPLMVVLSKEEKRLISEMEGESNNFCCFPDGSKEQDIKAFMGAEREDSFTLIQLKGE